MNVCMPSISVPLMMNKARKGSFWRLGVLGDSTEECVDTQSHWPSTDVLGDN